MWKVKVLKPGVTVVNAIGRRDANVPVGRMGWLPIDEAKQAADKGSVVILSNAGHQWYSTRVLKPAVAFVFEAEVPSAVAAPSKAKAVVRDK